jgi:hypothetical protein
MIDDGRPVLSTFTSMLPCALPTVGIAEAPRSGATYPRIAAVGVWSVRGFLARPASAHKVAGSSELGQGLMQVGSS